MKLYEKLKNRDITINTYSSIFDGRCTDVFTSGNNVFVQLERKFDIVIIPIQDCHDIIIKK